MAANLKDHIKLTPKKIHKIRANILVQTRRGLGGRRRRFERIQDAYKGQKATHRFCDTSISVFFRLFTTTVDKEGGRATPQNLFVFDRTCAPPSKSRVSKGFYVARAFYILSKEHKPSVRENPHETVSIFTRVCNPVSSETRLRRDYVLLSM